ncbi:uncharacterized HIT-like protein slr1234 [Chrysoperla carnea]|uniref:uncharacterized HIT-like protein slr1234 n=1 Tax=Chrysoperla carnea TaxID=189513 RepID=UPI001D096520|nr:uncharacterized HIT-like protein slr1234 [Chrysoperla carnea]
MNKILKLTKNFSNIKYIYSSVSRTTPIACNNWISNSSEFQIRKYSTEVEKAKTAKWNKNEGTIFDKIISKELKAEIIHEDDRCMAFLDVNPQAPVHFLVIPKRRIPMLDESSPEDIELLGHLILTAKNLAKERAPDGYRLVINNGVNGCQSVYHLHIHIVGGRQLNWPPG